MAPKSAAFKRLQQRLRRTLCYGRHGLKSLPLPLSEFAVDYFDKYSPYDSMNMDFATTLTRNICLDACTFLVAVVYLDRLRTTDKTCFEASEAEELYLSALMIASKYLHDDAQNEVIYNDEWAASASSSLKRVNELELNMLDAIQWNANVSEAEFMRILAHVEAWVARESFVKRGFSTYNETAILSSQINVISDCIKPLLLSLAMVTALYSVVVVSLLMMQQIAASSSKQREMFAKVEYSIRQLQHWKGTRFLSEENHYQKHKFEHFFTIPVSSSSVLAANVTLNHFAVWKSALHVWCCSHS